MEILSDDVNDTLKEMERELNRNSKRLNKKMDELYFGDYGKNINTPLNKEPSYKLIKETYTYTKQSE